MLNVLIVGGGPIHFAQLKSEMAAQPDFIIAADRGGSYLRKIGAFPHVLLGDFDSLSQADLSAIKEAKVEIQSFSPYKDFTDLELALDLALRKGADKIRILGGLGSRLDHTLGNIGILLKPLALGIETHLLDEFHDIILIKDSIELKNRPGWAVSLIPLSQRVTGVTTTGLLYPLTQAELCLNSGRGIHNEFTDESASIKIDGGTLIVVCFKEKQ